MLGLLGKDKFYYQEWMDDNEKKKIQFSIGIDYLMDYIRDRIWIDKNTPPLIKPKNMGDKVLILRSPTGTGKSALVAPALYNNFFDKMRKSIVLTQPTIANVLDIPYQIARFNKNLIIGENLGFQTSSVSKKPGKGILICTTGVMTQFLKILSDEDILQKYGFILIDEVHIRSIELDMCMFYIKKFLSKNWNNPDSPYFIFMSGTFNPTFLHNYFNAANTSFLDVKGQSYPIQDNFTNFDVSDYMEYCVDLVEKIHIDNLNDIINNEYFRHILIFVQGNSQIEKIEKKLHYLNYEVFSKGIEYSKKHSEEQQKKYITGGDENIYILPIKLMSINIARGEKEYMDLYSDIDTLVVDIYEDGDPEKKIIKTVKPSRKVMIGTNAVETGLSIDGLRYCIDTGFVKDIHFNPNYNCKVSFDKNITQASSRQRRGRVGRSAEGYFYACYTKETYDSLPELPVSDILKGEITNFLLNIIVQETGTELLPINYIENDNDIDIIQLNKFDQKWYKLKSNKKFRAELLDFIEYPSYDGITISIQKLHALGFIDNEYLPTLLGYIGSKLKKLSIETIRLIFAGYQHGAYILDLITIACFLENTNNFSIKKDKYKPRNLLNFDEKENEIYYHSVICDDFIEYLFIWYEYMSILDIISDNIENTDINYIEIMNDWTKKNNFSEEGINSITLLRDEVITDMLSIGLNPYYNSLGISNGKYNLIKILKRSQKEGLDEIKKIKKCIYEGFRMNISIWNETKNVYVNQVSNQDIEVLSKIPFYNENRPKMIVYSNVMFSKKKAGYKFYADDISVMDNFVDVDVEFMKH